MAQTWMALTNLDGSTIDQPTEKQISDAVDTVYDQSNQSFGSISLRYGYDDGLMYEMEIIGGGTVRFEEWSDQEYGVELAPPHIMMAIPKGRAFDLCRLMMHRQVGRIRKEPWVSMDRHKEKEWLIQLKQHH